MVKQRKNPKKRRQKGKGIIDTGLALIFGRKNLPPKVRNMLKKHGNTEIAYIQVARSPLETYTKIALDVVSLGEFSKKAKKLPYDKLYHLYAVITLKNGTNILLEKNDVINTEYKGVRANAESKMVPVSKPLTMNQLMANTKKKLGSKFLRYDAYKANCQNFIIGMLKGSNLGNESIYKFVKQDTRSIFSGSPTFAAITQFVTDLGARFDVLKQGAGIKKSHRAVFRL